MGPHAGMKRTLYALVPWMVLATAASGQVRSADVAYAYNFTIPTRAFRLGDECFIAIDGAAMWGWQIDVRGDQATVKAEGRTMTVPLRSIGGRPSLALRKAVSELGGDSAWEPGTDTLDVWSILSKVSFRRGRLQLSGSLSVKPTVFTQLNPNRLVVSLDGARLTRSTQLDLEDGVQVTQVRPNTVQIMIPTDSVPEVPGFNSFPARTFDMQFQAGGSRVVVTTPEVKPAEPVAPVNPPVTTPIPPLANGPLPIYLNAQSDRAAMITIQLPGLVGVTFTKPDPAVVEVKLPGIFRKLADGFRLDTNAVTGVDTRTYDGGTIVTFTLSRPMGVQLWTDGDGVQVQLAIPDVGNGRLAGKIVVVDPGHGGHDRGAHDGGVSEKDLNLAIGKLLSQELANQGATVIMTRKTDVFIPLDTRADIANRNHADLFISVHINSTGGSGSQTGTITFHHKGKDVSRVLAECIQKEIAKVNGLPDIGVWSDGRIYQSGFAVLRQTSMPGVLCELGFINNSRDRARMVTADFQNSVAKAIVRGLREYLGDE